MSRDRNDVRAAEDPGATPVEITVLNGDPTPQELVAVTAVLSAMAEETADDARLEGARARSAWQLSQIAVRQPLRPGSGAWRNFGRA